MTITHTDSECALTDREVRTNIYGAFLGGLKEGYDIVRKIWKGHPVIETLQDSYKDMDNNIEALNYGLLHPNDNCRNWLKDFDYKNNRWRK